MTEAAGKVKLTGEIVRPLLTLDAGKAFRAGEDGAIVITPDHTHSDILRYVVADIGHADAAALLDAITPAGRALLSEGEG